MHQPTSILRTADFEEYKKVGRPTVGSSPTIRFMRKMLAKPGEERIITKFLWFPVTINYERRWLEKVKIKMRREIEYTYAGYYEYWSYISFVDD